MKTVLQVIGGMNRAGAETFLMNVLRNIDRDNFRFVFLCYGNEPFDYEHEVHKLGGVIVRIDDVKVVGFLRHIKDVKAVIKEYGVDVVHAHTYFNSMFSIFAAWLCGVKLRITHSHNTVSEQNLSLKKKIYAFVSKLIINLLSTKLIACGTGAGKALFFRFRKFEVVANGINLDEFSYSKRTSARLRESLGIKETDKVILHIGRFEEAKNHRYLIKVFRDFATTHDSARLVLVGVGSYEESIRKQVYSYNLKDSVLFLGVRSDVAALYSLADVFVFPSLYEGMPVTLVEAQANGLPCLISDRIDNDVALSEDIIFLSIESKPIVWASTISGMSRSNRGLSTKLSDKYDIGVVNLRLQCIYAGELL